MIFEGWESHYSGVVQSLLPRPVSDHNLILLDGSGVRRGLTPFRFENMWLKVNGFRELLSSNWGEIEMFGSASFKLVEKLKALKSLLKKWNKDEFSNVYERKAFALRSEFLGFFGDKQTSIPRGAKC